MDTQRTTRREVIQSMTAGAAALLLGRASATAQNASKNDIVSLGLIGCGGRLRGLLLSGLRQIPSVRVDAVCDVYEGFLNSAHAAVGGREREVFRTRDYRAILDRKDIDAVVIATPDHWHTPMTIDTCEAGKPVYVEKPLTWCVEMISASRAAYRWRA
jgi:predicted dehydrogenase